MKTSTIVRILIALVVGTLSMLAQQAGLEQVTIKGTVTDFEDTPIEGASVQVKGPNLETKYETVTDAEGKYTLTVEKGKYFAISAIRPDEIAGENSSLQQFEQRLGFWAWNVVATENLDLNIHYHRLEVYGVSVFKIQDGKSGYTIYCRPTSLSRSQSVRPWQLKDTDLAPDPYRADVSVEINGFPVNVNMIQKVEEYVAEGVRYGYLIHVDGGGSSSGTNIFRIEITDLVNGDTGEAIYFRESDNYN